ncbi:MAG: efflux RND transporter periplasmic adaptor subunit [Syntrophales bacterium]|nr:efflux RND transporter periplasmic adaptor subunit [Syntrophales bacterium]
MKKIIIAILIIAFVAGGVFLATRGNSDFQNFKTEKASLGDIRSTVTATGTVNPVKTVLVGTQVSGTIKTLHVDFNSFVKKGQLLAQIDPSTFDAQVDQAKANLFSAEANVEKAEAALLEVKRALVRNKALFSSDLIARSELDTSETNEMSAAAQLKAARAQVEQSRAALRVAETNLRYTNIISPVDGMVISRNVDVGQTVAASFQTPTLFNIAQDLSRMQIDTNVDEADIGRIRFSQPVEFTVDAYPDKTFRGLVSVIRNAPITVQNVVTYDVVVLVQNQEFMLKPGMTANVAIITATKKDVLKIPNAALRFQMDRGTKADRAPEAEALKGGKSRERKGPGIWLLENKTPKRVSVSLGISDGNNTEIVAGSLKEGDEVILSSTVSKNKQEVPLSRGWFR